MRVRQKRGNLEREGSVKKVKGKFVIGGLILVIAMGYLFYVLLDNSLSYYVTVSELLEDGSNKYGESVRVGGTIAEGSLEWDPAKPELRFALIDEGARLPIFYEGVMPDSFAAGKDIVIEGKYNPDGIFYAQDLILKCPSKYDPRD